MKDQKVAQVGMIRNGGTRAQAQSVSRAHTVPPSSASCPLAYAQHSVSITGIIGTCHVLLRQMNKTLHETDATAAPNL